MTYPTLHGHHVHSPSSLHRRAACPGSGRMELQFAGDDTPSEAAAEGTLLHKSMATPDAIPLAELNAEHRELNIACNKVYMAYRNGQYRELHESTHYELDMELLDEDGEILTAGTADVVIVFREHVVVLDWKFGRVPVSVDSLQLMAYGAMGMQRFGKPTAEVVIFQPRVSGKPQTKDYDDLETIVDDIAHLIFRTTGDALNLNPTDDGCKYCKAFDHCPAVQITALEVADLDAAAIEPSRAAEFYSKATLVERHVKAIKAEVKRMALEGPVPGVEIKEKQGRRTGFNPVDLALALYVLPSPLQEFAKISYADAEAFYFDVIADKGLTKKANKEIFADLVKEILERSAPSQEVILTKEDG